jgi:hypothetical protein
VLAQGRVVEDIRISRNQDQAEILIELACQMRFQADVATQGGALLELRVAPFDTCRQLGIGQGVSSELYRPIGAQIAHLVEVEFESLGLGDSLVMLTFDRPVQYSVTQGATLRSVRIVIDLAEAPLSRAVPLEPPPDVPPDAPSSAADAEPRISRPGRDPLSVRVIAPSTTADYVINLQSTREPPGPALADLVPLDPGQRLYVSETRVDGQVWYRLRAGFFASEADARLAAEPLKQAFPRAWVGRAEPAEIRTALEFQFEGEDDRTIPTVSIEQLEADAPDLSGLPEGSLEPDRIAAFMSEARSAMLSGRNENAIRLYTRLLLEPGEHRAEAREFLGLARQRNGQLARARGEYEAYLREFEGSPGAARVRQRLDGLIASVEAPREPLRAAAGAGEGARWEKSMGVAQYYRRDLNQFDQDQQEIVTQEALLTDMDFSLRRDGENIDLLTRLSLNHFMDLLSPEENGRGDQNRVSYAYVDLAQTQQQWSLRLGRQSLHTWGVLGRFDGAHFDYGLGADKQLHFMAGHPVESTRDSVETDRQFYGVAVEFDDLIGSWDLAAYLNTQTIEGVDARMAVGTELRYFDDKRSLTAMLDYDIDFSELNMVLVLGTWRFDNRVTLSALLDSRQSPILTTRNALIGQPVTTVEELLIVWSEEEVRQLAIDRTAASQTVTLGVAAPLAERFQINFDVTATEIDATVGSGGVLAQPGTGPQTFYSTSLVGTGLFGSGDVSIFNLRTGQADTFETSLFTWDARFPIGRRIRINPRIRYVVWEGIGDGRKRTTVSPSLRFLFNTRNRYRLEFEVGRDDMTREDLNGVQDSYGSYFNLGYRANF